MKIIKRVLYSFLLVLLPHAPVSANNCNKYDYVVEYLASIGEQIIWIGAGNETNRYFILFSGKESWTFVVTDKNIACVLSDGKSNHPNDKQI